MCTSNIDITEDFYLDFHCSIQTSFKHVNFSRLKVKFHDFSVTLKKYVSSELFPDLTFLNDIISDRKIQNRGII